MLKPNDTMKHTLNIKYFNCHQKTMSKVINIFCYSYLDHLLANVVTLTWDDGVPS